MLCEAVYIPLPLRSVHPLSLPGPSKRKKRRKKERKKEKILAKGKTARKNGRYWKK